MSYVQILVNRCHELGAEILPQADGKLKVRAPTPLPDELIQELRQRKAEVVALLLTHPYVNGRGELIIPFTTDPRFHWWANGQSIVMTLQELNAPPEVWRRYVDRHTEAMNKWRSQ